MLRHSMQFFDKVSKMHRNNTFKLSVPSSSCSRVLKIELSDLNELMYGCNINSITIEQLKKRLNAQSLIQCPETNILLKRYLKEIDVTNLWLQPKSYEQYPKLLTTIECYELAVKMFHDQTERCKTNYTLLRKMLPIDEIDNYTGFSVIPTEETAENWLIWLTDECINIIQRNSDFCHFIDKFKQL